MKQMKTVFLFFSLLTSVGYAQQITSPDKKIKVVLEQKSAQNKVTKGEGRLYFKVLYKKGASYVEVLPSSPLGIIRADQQFVSNLKFINESKSVAVHDNYKMLAGKSQTCENYGTEKTFRYQNSSKQPLDITFRAYNDGVTFRYTFPNHADGSFSITDEATAFYTSGISRWMQPFQQSYEKFYPLNTQGTDEKGNMMIGRIQLYIK